MDAEKYWREFLHSGKITDYMSYKNEACVEKERPGERQTGDVDIERFRACDRHSNKDGESWGI